MHNIKVKNTKWVMFTVMINFIKKSDYGWNKVMIWLICHVRDFTLFSWKESVVGVVAFSQHF